MNKSAASLKLQQQWPAISELELQDAIARAEFSSPLNEAHIQQKAYLAGYPVCPIFKQMVESYPESAVEDYEEFLVGHLRSLARPHLNQLLIDQSNVEGKCRLWLAVAFESDIYKREKRGNLKQFYADYNLTKDKGQSLRTLGKSLREIANYARENIESGDIPFFMWSMLRALRTPSHIECALYCLKKIGPDRVYKLLCNPILHFRGKAQPYDHYTADEAEAITTLISKDPDAFEKLIDPDAAYVPENHADHEDEDLESPPDAEVSENVDDEEAPADDNAEVQANDNEQPNQQVAEKNKKKKAGGKNHEAVIRAVIKSTRSTFYHIRDFFQIDEADVAEEHLDLFSDAAEGVLNLKNKLNSWELVWNIPWKKI
jgi:hypothetical protein